MKRFARPVLVCAFAGLLAVPAFADDMVTTINVSMWDSGPESMADMDAVHMMGVVESDEDMSEPTMGFTLDVAEVPAGEVTFIATNDSTAFEHEMVVAPVADTSVPLPYIEAEDRVDEDAAGAIGEVAETEPGESGSVTLHLDPGTYILFCNVADHYAMGMWTLLTVTG